MFLLQIILLDTVEGKPLIWHLSPMSSGSEQLVCSMRPSHKKSNLGFCNGLSPPGNEFEMKSGPQREKLNSGNTVSVEKAVPGSSCVSFLWVTWSLMVQYPAKLSWPKNEISHRCLMASSRHVS